MDLAPGYTYRSTVSVAIDPVGTWRNQTYVKSHFQVVVRAYASEYIFSGSLSSQKVKEIASTTISKLDLIANHNSEWSSDALGIMQLFTLKYLLRKFED